jgi:hypothetical protein
MELINRLNLGSALVLQDGEPTLPEAQISQEYLSDAASRAVERLLAVSLSTRFDPPEVRQLVATMVPANR